MELNFNYIKNTPFEKRKGDYLKVTAKYPSKLPILMETPNNQIDLKKTKFLMDYDQSLNDLIISFRKTQQLLPAEAIFLYAYDKKNLPIILSGSDTMGIIYEKYKYNDGFLYIHVQKENTFGH